METAMATATATSDTSHHQRHGKKQKASFKRKAAPLPPVPPTPTAPAPTTTMTVAKGNWLCCDGTVRLTLNAKKMEKMRRIKPAVDQIKKARSIKEQAAALRPVIDHPKLADAR